MAAHPPAPPSPREPQPDRVAGEAVGRFRWVICSLLFCSVAVNYIDRLVIGVLKRPLCDELGWTDQDYGYIAAAFSFAYALDTSSEDV
jgi:MFS transporter, ACS family, hexuronate transporter